MRFERAEPKKRKAKPGEWFAWQNGEPAQWIGKYETISEYYILRPIPEKEEAVENDRLAKLEAEVSGHRESIAALDAEVARLRDEIQDNVSSIAETDASHEALVEEVARLAAKVDAPPCPHSNQKHDGVRFHCVDCGAVMDAPPEKKPRRMKANAKDFTGSIGLEGPHGIEHYRNEQCDAMGCLPVKPEPAKKCPHANTTTGLHVQEGPVITCKDCGERLPIPSPEPGEHKECDHSLKTHYANSTIICDICGKVLLKYRKPKEGEPSYPWPDAPEGTVAAAYESDTIPIWFFCRVADEGFHFRTIRIRNGASLNGCAWEKSLRVNPKFKGGK